MSRLRLLRHGGTNEEADAGRRRHVLLVVDQLQSALGGGERIVLTMAARLPAYGYKVSILTFAADERSAALIDPPCPVYLLPLQRTYDVHALAGALALRQFLKEQQVDLVHTCFESSDLWAGGMTKLLSRAKLVWNRRDMGILRGRKHAIAYKRMAGLPDAVFAVSEEVRRYTIEVDGIDPARVTTIHNGLDLARWPERSVSQASGAPILASLGNIRRVKGHDVLVRAFAVVHREMPEAKLRVGGAVLEPDFMDELTALIAELGLAQSVSFAGGVQDQQAFLQSASMFVLPSRSEGFSNAIVEAMAASLPVVATNVGGNAEAVVDGVTGLIVASEESAAMAAAMLRMLRNPAEAAAMGLAGRERVVAQFTTEAMMRRVIDAFDRVLTSV